MSLPPVPPRKSLGAILSIIIVIPSGIWPRSGILRYGGMAPKWLPKLSQNGPKKVPRIPKGILGWHNGMQMGTRGTSEEEDRARVKMAQDRSKMLQRSAQGQVGCKAGHVGSNWSMLADLWECLGSHKGVSGWNSTAVRERSRFGHFCWVTRDWPGLPETCSTVHGRKARNSREERNRCEGAGLLLLFICLLLPLLYIMIININIIFAFVICIITVVFSLLRCLLYFSSSL